VSYQKTVSVGVRPWVKNSGIFLWGLMIGLALGVLSLFFSTEDLNKARAVIATKNAVIVTKDAIIASKDKEIQRLEKLMIDIATELKVTKREKQDDTR
jgi:hypothetical protein